MNYVSPVLPEGTKCTRCRSQARFKMPAHNANFCPECFEHYFRTSVLRAMKKFRVAESAPMLVAVSGGKDSLALWSVLNDLGYPTRGIHIDLGIEDFSETSVACIDAFAAPRGLQWTRYSLRDVVGYSVPEIRDRTWRKICSICGFLKRQLLNRLTIGEGFDLIALGHNLDDEAGRMLGNMMRHRTQYFEKQYPYLPSNHPRMASRLKPLYRLESWEIKIYCELKGISYFDVKCPLSHGATSHSFKEALDFLESRMPGTKRDFLFTYLSRRMPPQSNPGMKECKRCGEPAFDDQCSVCDLLDHLRRDDKTAGREDGETG